MKSMKEWSTFENAKASVVEKTIEFAGRTWKPTRQIAFVTASLCHPLPVSNSKRRGFTAATLANSFDSIVLQMADFEHMLEFYGSDNDRICGVIAAAEYPKKKKAIELAEAGEKVPLNVLFAVWRKAAGTEKLLEDMAADTNPWKTSMECEWPVMDTALFDGKKIYPWSECSSDMKELVTPSTVKDWDGKKMLLLMGGEDGTVNSSGAAFTKYPADKSTEVTQMAASDRPDCGLISMGWKNAADWRLAHAIANDKPIFSQTASIVIGKTDPDPDDGHQHEILVNLDIMPTNGHTHYFRPLQFKDGVLEGVTSSWGAYDSRAGRYVDHAHKVSISGTAAEAASATKPTIVEPPELSTEEIRKLARLR